LGLIVGSSLSGSPLRVFRSRTTSAGVEVHDAGIAVVLLRHGVDGKTPAHRVDHHANVVALCEAGCDRIVALGSAGGLRAELGPGTIIAPDDFLALATYPTFHDDTTGYAVPGFDATWRHAVVAAWSSSIVDGGTYAQVRGPRFETPAEIRFLAHFADVVGMTIAAECVLAREAGLAYAAVCKVDNLANGIVAGTASVLDQYRDNAAAGADQFAAQVAGLITALS
jgi:purine nucleoside phosphorylase